MEKEIIIRQFEEKDVDELYEVIQRAFDAYLLKNIHEKITRDIWTKTYTKDYISGIAKLKHLYVAICDNKIAGCAAVSLENSMAYVSAVCVDPDAHGKNIDKKLMAAIEQDEISRSAKKIYLNAPLTSAGFYNNSGYFSEKETPDILSDSGVDIVQLFKTL